MNDELESWLYKYPPLKGTDIAYKDLPKDSLSPDHELLVLNKKKKYKWKIAFDVTVQVLLLLISTLVLKGIIYIDGLTNKIIVLAFTILVMGALLNELRKIPKRVIYYKDYNFERTCYATVSSKFYKRMRSARHRRNTTTIEYNINLQINEDSHLKGFNVKDDEYRMLSDGDRVIVACFDGRNAVLIFVDENETYKQEKNL